MSRSPKLKANADVEIEVPAGQGDLLLDAKRMFETAQQQFNLVFATIAAGVGMTEALLVDVRKRGKRTFMVVRKEPAGEPAANAPKPSLKKVG